MLDSPGKRAHAVCITVSCVRDGRARGAAAQTRRRATPTAITRNHRSTSCPSQGRRGPPTGDWAVQRNTIRAKNPTRDEIVLALIGPGADVECSWLKQLAAAGVVGVVAPAELSTAIAAAAAETHIAPVSSPAVTRSADRDVHVAERQPFWLPRHSPGNDGKGAWP